MFEHLLTDCVSSFYGLTVQAGLLGYGEHCVRIQFVLTSFKYSIISFYVIFPLNYRLYAKLDISIIRLIEIAIIYDVCDRMLLF